MLGRGEFIEKRKLRQRYDAGLRHPHSSIRHMKPSSKMVHSSSEIDPRKN